jgi:2-phosphosulfolactate phosphatase
VRVDVAFTPAEAREAPVGVVVDVMRATSTIVQALASGYERVLCTVEIEDALRLKGELAGAVTAGERGGRNLPEFDLGNSPAEFTEPRGDTLILSTTNGTRAIVAAAATCETVLIGSLLNLRAVAAAVRERGEDALVLCSGWVGGFALDDALCAGRIVDEIGASRTDAAIAASLVSRSFPDAVAGISARTYGPDGLEDDIRWCARESVLDAVPRLAGMRSAAAEVTL